MNRSESIAYAQSKNSGPIGKVLYLLRHIMKASFATITFVHPSYEDNYHDHHTNNEHTKLNAQEILYHHEADHHQVGLTVQLTIDDLERLNFLLQPPSGGLMDDPPIHISDTLLIRN